MVGKEYSVSFKLFPTKLSPGWHNVLHFTTGTDHGQPGSRIPAVWLHKSAGDSWSRSLYICSFVNRNVNYCWTSGKIKANRLAKIEIRQTRRVLDYNYEILINGIVQHEVSNYLGIRAFENVKLYVSDPWHAAQEGLIKDLEYSRGGYNFDFH